MLYPRPMKALRRSRQDLVASQALLIKAVIATDLFPCATKLHRGRFTVV
jgi:hypothetical protein